MGSTLRKTIFAYTIIVICTSSVFGVISGCDRQTHSGPVVVQDKPLAVGPPFVLAVALGRRGITLDQRTPHDADLPRPDFYVLLSNVSKQAQTVWEDWNSAPGVLGG